MTNFKIFNTTMTDNDSLAISFGLIFEIHLYVMSFFITFAVSGGFPRGFVRLTEYLNINFNFICLTRF